MKVLLYEDIKGLGWLGDVVDVNNGYARNYLLPQGFAKIATQENIDAIADEKAQRATERIKERNRLEKAVEAIQKAAPEVVLAAKANENGVLFGSINESHIAKNLREQGFGVADAVVKMTEHLKTLGSHTVQLKFSDDLIHEVTVTIVSEDQASDQGEAAAGPESPGVDESMAY